LQGEQGSVLFTYVHGDPFCEREEASKAATTSSTEQQAPLYQKIMADAKRKQEVRWRWGAGGGDVGGGGGLPGA